MDIPLDEWTVIMSYMDYRSVARMGRTNKAFYNLSELYIDPSMDQQMPIIVSCSRGYVTAVEKLLKDKRVNPHVRNDLPFRAACRNGRTEVVKLLLEEASLWTQVQRTQGDCCFNEGMVEACRRGHVEVVKLLLQGYCQPDYMDYRAISIASQRRDQAGYELTKLLAPYGHSNHVFRGYLKIDRIQILGTSPAFLIVEACQSSNVDLVEYLTPSATTEELRKALRTACTWDHQAIVKILLTNSRLESDPQALTKACRTGCNEIVRMLLADPRWEARVTDLIEANNYDILSMILADLIGNGKLFTTQATVALHKAAVSGDVDSVRLLLPHGEPEEALIAACAAGHLGVVELLFPLVPEEVLSHGFGRAVVRGHRRIAELLLPILPRCDPDPILLARKGYYKLVKLFKGWNQATLAAACDGGHYKLVRLILQYPVDIPFRALCEACSGGHDRVVKLLLNDPRCEPRTGNLVWVARNHHKVVELLLKDGRADPSKDNNRALLDSHDANTIQLLLADPRVDPTINNQEVIRTARSVAVLRVLLQDCRLDPAANDNQLIKKASYHNVEMVKLLLRDGRVNPLCDHYQPVINAFSTGHVEIVKELLRGRDINRYTLIRLAKDIHQCVRYAIYTHDLELLRWLKDKVELDYRQGVHISQACHRGNYQVLDYLLAYSSPIYRSSDCLYYASQNDLKMVELLLDDGRVSLEDGDMVIDICLVGGGDTAIRIIKKLLEGDYDAFERAISLYQLAFDLRDIRLLNLLMEKLEPGEWGETLMDMADDEEMRKYLLRDPSMNEYLV